MPWEPGRDVDEDVAMETRRSFAGLMVLALSVWGLVACGSGTKGASTSSSTTSSVGTTGSTTSTPSTSSTTPNGTASVTVYFVRDEKVGAVRRSGAAGTPARAAMDALLSGPSASERTAGLTSAVPSGTKVLGLTIAGGVATIDLSTEFGSGGGSLSMQERVAQVVYTLTQFSTAQKVSFRMGGKPVTALGGEGLILDQPQSRSDWEAMTPAILLETPLPGDALTSPFSIKGTANTFEATFMVTLTDSSGKQLYEHFVTATSGTGTRGTFDDSITFAGANKGAGTLVVWEASAKDGSHINVVSIPVTL